MFPEKCFLFYEFCLCLLAWSSNSIIVTSKRLVILSARAVAQGKIERDVR